MYNRRGLRILEHCRRTTRPKTYVKIRNQRPPMSMGRSAVKAVTNFPNIASFNGSTAQRVLSFGLFMWFCFLVPIRVRWLRRAWRWSPPRAGCGDSPGRCPAAPASRLRSGPCQRLREQNGGEQRRERSLREQRDGSDGRGQMAQRVGQREIPAELRDKSQSQQRPPRTPGRYPQRNAEQHVDDEQEDRAR